jgi:hypothetical protein
MVGLDEYDRQQFIDLRRVIKAREVQVYDFHGTLLLETLGRKPNTVLQMVMLFEDRLADASCNL